jgi:hypothetical protein
MLRRQPNILFSAIDSHHHHLYQSTQCLIASGGHWTPTIWATAIHALLYLGYPYGQPIQ